LILKHELCFKLSLKIYVKFSIELINLINFHLHSIFFFLFKFWESWSSFFWKLVKNESSKSVIKVFFYLFINFYWFLHFLLTRVSRVTKLGLFWYTLKSFSSQTEKVSKFLSFKINFSKFFFSLDFSYVPIFCE